MTVARYEYVIETKADGVWTHYQRDSDPSPSAPERMV